MSDARTAILITLDPAHEGGFQKMHNDHANWTSGVVGVGTLVGTNGGITALDMPGADIEHLTDDQKISYYMDHYWKPLYAQITSQLVANKLFDLGVLFGVGTAVKAMQAILPVVVDGVFGSQTLAVINAAHEGVVLVQFKLSMKAHAHDVAMRNPNEDGFLHGWLQRIDS